MTQPHIASLVSKYPLISDQIKRPALETVLGGLADTLDREVAGAVVEFGCYIGTTSLFLRRLLDLGGQSEQRELHVYDSFEGLPPKTIQDASAAGEDFQAGALHVSRKQLLEQFRRANLRPPIIHKGWFDALPDQAVPDTIAFAFLDGDFYGSIIDSLRLVWPRLADGGIVTIDDYKRETLPGVERAVQDYFQDKKYASLSYAHNIAVIRK